MILNFLAEVYHGNLSNEARKYLNSRGITDHAINYFKIGYCSNNIGYREVLKNKFSGQEIKKSKMFRKTEEGQVYDFFFNKITFPISFYNNVESFSSRAIGNKWVGKSNSPHLHKEGPITIAFNHDILTRDKTTYVVIVESPIDAITLEINGINSISVMGVSRLTRRIVEDLHGKEIYIWFDYDPNNSGQNGAKRMAQKLIDNGLKSSIIEVPEAYNKKRKIDPNDFFVNGGKRKDFNILIESSTPYLGTKKRQKIYKSITDKNIVELAEQYIEIEPVGGRFRAMCPFHEDSKPSLIIYPNNNSFYCFGCNRGGNTETLERLLKNV